MYVNHLNLSKLEITRWSQTHQYRRNNLYLNKETKPVFTIDTTYANEG